MRVVAFNGSPRPEGNTSRMLDRVLSAIAAEGIDTEKVQLGGRLIRGCTACGKCKQLKDSRCILPGDLINDCIQKMLNADGILLGSPTYFSDLTSEMKAFIDRTGYVCRANGDLLRRKAGAAVVSMRRAGGIHTFNSLNHFFTVSQMVVVGSSYWNLGLGRDQGDVEQDTEGMETMQTLGENMAWLIKRIQS